jgi:general L-amino acid transport system permease protein
MRVLVGITLFAAAYMAEVIRGGLQAIPKGQLEAAPRWACLLADAAQDRAAAGAGHGGAGIMNNFIGLFKDTSLVTIVSLYELTGALGWR